MAAREQPAELLQKFREYLSQQGEGQEVDAKLYTAAWYEGLRNRRVAQKFKLPARCQESEPTVFVPDVPFPLTVALSHMYSAAAYMELHANELLSVSQRLTAFQKRLPDKELGAISETVSDLQVRAHAIYCGLDAGYEGLARCAEEDAKPVSNCLVQKACLSPCSVPATPSAGDLPSASTPPPRVKDNVRQKVISRRMTFPCVGSGKFGRAEQPSPDGPFPPFESLFDDFHLPAIKSDPDALYEDENFPVSLAKKLIPSNMDCNDSNRSCQLREPPAADKAENIFIS